MENNKQRINAFKENDYKTINSIKNFEGIKIHYQKNRGYGSAIIEGIKITNTKFFCIINADGSMNPNYLDEMKDKKSNNYS